MVELHWRWHAGPVLDQTIFIRQQTALPILFWNSGIRELRVRVVFISIKWFCPEHQRECWQCGLFSVFRTLPNVFLLSTMPWINLGGLNSTKCRLYLRLTCLFIFLLRPVLFLHLQTQPSVENQIMMETIHSLLLFPESLNLLPATQSANHHYSKF